MIKRKRLVVQEVKRDIEVSQKHSGVSAADAMDKMIKKLGTETPNQEKLSHHGKREYQNG